MPQRQAAKVLGVTMTAEELGAFPVAQMAAGA
jgi:hypothetical protein